MGTSGTFVRSTWGGVRAAAKARRWVVERMLAWLSRCRALLVRYDEHWEDYLDLIQFACSPLRYRRFYSIRAA
jgi:transposase